MCRAPLLFAQQFRPTCQAYHAITWSSLTCLIPSPVYVSSRSASSVYTSTILGSSLVNKLISLAGSSTTQAIQLPAMAPRKSNNKASAVPAATTKTTGTGVAKRRYPKVRFLENGLVDVERKAGKFLKM